MRNVKNESRNEENNGEVDRNGGRDFGHKTQNEGSIGDAQDEVRRTVMAIEKKQEQQEIRDRRDNVLLYGVPELGDDTHENCETKFVQIVNEVLPTPMQASDIVRAHRVGKRAAGKTRPLIARMLRSVDKLNILQKRKELREKGIGVSADLTNRQREEIRRAREDGYFAYYRGGILHKEERRTKPAVAERPRTRSYARAISEARSDT